MRTPVRRVREDLRRHDVLLAAAGLTFYAVIGFIPLLLIAFWLAGLILGSAELRSLGATAGYLIGNRHGLGGGLEALVRAAIGPSVATLLSSALVAAWYGEGLARALGRFGERSTQRRGIWGRLATPALAVSTSILLTSGCLVGQWLTDALGTSDSPTFPRIYIAFVVAWFGLTVNVGLCYLVFGPVRPALARMWLMAALAASWIAGSALGFLLVASWSINISAPFAGNHTLASAALVAVWLYFSHVALLVSYAAAVRLSNPEARPDGPRPSARVNVKAGRS